jgi:arylsulfatase A-like enzyme
MAVTYKLASGAFMRRHLAMLLATGFVVVSTVTVGVTVWLAEPTELRDDLPNVVLIVLCSTRADMTPWFSDVFDTMPSLGTAMADGVVFEDGITAAPWTRPAITAIVSGAHPGTLGLLEPLARRSNRVVPESADILSERLNALGFYTVGRSANPNVSRTFGFDQGFDDFNNLSETWRQGVTKIPGMQVSESVLAALDDRPTETPVFIQAVYVDAHQPFDVSKRTGRLWRTAEEPLRVGRYRGMLRKLDAAVSTLVVGLSERDITPENSIFVVVNDHGEGLIWPTHHGRGHGRYLYPTTTKLVWIMAGVGVDSGRIQGLASQVDIAPTIMEIIGEPQAGTWEGQSLAASVRDASIVTGRQRAFSATMFSDTQRGAVFSSSAACLHDYGDGTAQGTEVNRSKPVFEASCFERTSAELGSTAAYPELGVELDSWWSDMRVRLDAWGDNGADIPDDLDAMLHALGYTDDP